MSILSGYSRQWLNKLVDRGEVPGCQRKANGRLGILDEEKAAEWASRARKPKLVPARYYVDQREWDSLELFRELGARRAISGKSDPAAEAKVYKALDWAAHARTVRHRRARRIVMGTIWRHSVAKSISRIAKEEGVTRQSLFQALKRLDIPREAVQATYAKGPCRARLVSLDGPSFPLSKEMILSNESSYESDFYFDEPKN